LKKEMRDLEELVDYCPDVDEFLVSKRVPCWI
jgi:hypothetical protein